MTTLPVPPGQPVPQTAVAAHGQLAGTAPLALVPLQQFSSATQVNIEGLLPLIRERDALNEENKQLRHDIKELREELAYVNAEKLRKLETLCTEQQQRIDALLDKNGKLATDFNKLKEENEAIRKELADLQREMRELNQALVLRQLALRFTEEVLHSLGFTANVRKEYRIDSLYEVNKLAKSGQLPVELGNAFQAWKNNLKRDPHFLTFKSSDAYWAVDQALKAMKSVGTELAHPKALNLTQAMALAYVSDLGNKAADAAWIVKQIKHLP